MLPLLSADVGPESSHHLPLPVLEPLLPLYSRLQHFSVQLLSLLPLSLFSLPDLALPFLPLLLLPLELVQIERVGY